MEMGDVKTSYKAELIVGTCIFIILVAAITVMINKMDMGADIVDATVVDKYSVLDNTWMKVATKNEEYSFNTTSGSISDLEIGDSVEIIVQYIMDENSEDSGNKIKMIRKKSSEKINTTRWNIVE